MVDILRLQPKPEPKLKTANYRSKNLKDHFESFLNVNNLTGFLSPEQEVKTTESLIEMLALFTKNQTVSAEHFQSVVDEVYQIVNNGHKGTPKFVHRRRVRDFVARVLGYASHRSLIEASRKQTELPDETVKNRRTTDSAVKYMGRFIRPKGSLPLMNALTDFVLSFDVTQPRPDFQPDTVEGELIRYMWHDRTTRDSMSKHAKRIRKLLNNELRHTEVLNLLAVSFGYYDYSTLAVRVPGEKNIVFPNLRKTPSIPSL